MDQGPFLTLAPCPRSTDVGAFFTSVLFLNPLYSCELSVCRLPGWGMIVTTVWYIRFFLGVVLFGGFTAVANPKFFVRPDFRDPSRLHGQLHTSHGTGAGQDIASSVVFLFCFRFLLRLTCILCRGVSCVYSGSSFYDHILCVINSLDPISLLRYFICVCSSLLFSSCDSFENALLSLDTCNFGGVSGGTDTLNPSDTSDIKCTRHFELYFLCLS